MFWFHISPKQPKGQKRLLWEVFVTLRMASSVAQVWLLFSVSCCVFYWSRAKHVSCWVIVLIYCCCRGLQNYSCLLMLFTLFHVATTNLNDFLLKFDAAVTAASPLGYNFTGFAHLKNTEFLPNFICKIL